MHGVYLVCFVVGLATSLILAAVGNLHLGLHAHGHTGGHVGGHAHAAGHAHVGGQGGSHTAGAHHGTAGHLGASAFDVLLSFLSPIALAGGLLLFGGTGLLFGSGPLGLSIAVAMGLVGAIILRSLMAALIGSSTEPLALTGEGAIGTINATVRPDAPGEVIYTLEGLHRSVAARNADHLLLPRGTQVVITKREGGFAWVEPLDRLESFEKGGNT